eukprot:gb/GFBE01031107.1/.p1 GENE.gb/GFBE01031107.1/~~gb/GFBE01031107.1/.p1  ORF type:complete len:251 (+),score=22.08 gb/GFBE01031107.1/:1-753(+)
MPARTLSNGTALNSDLAASGACRGFPPGSEQLRPGNLSVEVPQAQCQVQIPQGAEPGSTFVATTPDGQAAQITVPEGSSPGSTVMFHYVPVPTMTNVVGKPVVLPTLGALAMPPSQCEMRPGDHRETEDTQRMWLMYFAGWVVCCVCPLGCGPAYWFAVACLYWKKPAEDKEKLRQERRVALMSLITGMISIALVFVFTLLIVVPAVQNNGEEACSPERVCDFSLQLHDDRSDCNTFGGLCYAIDRRRRR